ncbi:DUF2325 domain-containing protein [Clostridium niameyense]|uniref:DUF2325 domain-containing protein n=1 Tax=Clostridium niameyense TaxID=1622073 RepID=A0A6M0RAB1_9CLOT|nr:DUF2325 domain-containing protein [Clostridium niameyense]NEZ47146.1 DUF2325 domain-containing protein [Clostridium niameyense]
MSAFVVGGDRINTIKENLKEMGFDEINHISGRRKRHRKLQVPVNTDLVLVLTDFIGHNVVESVKEQVKANKDTQVIYAKRSWTNIERCLRQTYNKQI